MATPSTGVHVFGSAVIRVEPDLVSLQFGVGRQAAKTRDALREAQQAALAVRAFLTKAGVSDVASSRLTLSQTTEYKDGKPRPTGYYAKFTFNVILTDLTKMEEVLVGVVDAGVNEIGSTEFRTTRLKELRMEARRRAVASAREKAENYCRAAGVTLGPVTAIEDQRPESLSGNYEQNTSREEPTDDSATTRALAPNAIPVGAAVSVTFALT
jgi:uncharacterized protein YggE